MKSWESIDGFLDSARISAEDWAAADIDLLALQAIAKDHEGQVERLRDSAELFAKVIQRIPSVHSVRWRIKDPLHLLEKIVRKRAEKSEKYANVSVDNYSSVVTDLVGVRALHLFKDDCFHIDESLRATWKPVETAIAYVRAGDEESLNQRYTDRGFDVRPHPKGYRSIHYVFSNQPHQRKVFAEVQVRSIFEEGWSEIDHRIRYPNFSEQPLVEYFLTIFNRLAGNADEMGSFVRTLAADLARAEGLVKLANKERDEALSKMELTLSELVEVKEQGAASKDKVKKLQGDLAKLRSATLNTLGVDDMVQRLGLGRDEFSRYVTGLKLTQSGQMELERLAQEVKMRDTQHSSVAEFIRMHGLGGGGKKPRES